MKEPFLILRILTGVASVAGLGVLFVLIFLQSAASFAKESVQAVGSVATMFASGFQKNPPLQKAAGWVFTMPQAGVGCLLLLMLLSAFYPSNKMLLHPVAAGYDRIIPQLAGELNRIGGFL